MNTFYTFPKNPPSIEIIGSDGSYLIDKSRNKILDATSGSTHNSIIGFNNKKVINSIIKQLNNISNIDYKDWLHSEREELSKLISNNMCKSLNKVFYSGQSGSEACEAAIMMSFQIHQENNNLKKKYIISTYESYHGSTLNSIAAGDRKHTHYLKKIFSKNHIKISENDPIRNKNYNETEDQYTKKLLNELKDVIKKYGSDKISCLIGEPILGGLQGDITPSKNYWNKVSEICKKENIHLIMDEIYHGTGISGKYQTSSWEKICPDFILLGKTLGAGYSPLSAVVTNKKFEDIIKNGSGRVTYSSTHQAHSLGVIAALNVQKYILNNNLINQAHKKEKYIKNIISSELKNNPHFKIISGRGLRLSIHYDTSNNVKFGRKFKQELFNNHKILIDSKWHRIGLRPQMNIKKSDLDFLIECVIKTFNKIEKI